MDHRQSQIEEFLGLSVLAVAGVSRGGKKFGNRVYRDLLRKGYRVYALNPNTTEAEGSPCYPDLAALPEPVDGVISVVPPQETEKLVREARAMGISQVWMQPGAESPAAIAFCVREGINVVANECIMTFPAPHPLE
jgi:uncharacterized protein